MKQLFHTGDNGSSPEWDGVFTEVMDRQYKLILMKENMFPVVSVCLFRGAIR